MRYSEEQYLDDYMEDQDVDISCQTVKLVKTKKDHECHFCAMEGDFHIIKAGELARYEKCLVDHDFWGRYYACISGLDKWIAAIESERCDDCAHWDYENETPEEKAFCLNSRSGYSNTMTNYFETCDCFKRGE